MGPPLADASTSSRSREVAIETLIDMDPNGAAYRIAKAKNAALIAALRDRPNRMTDGALFDAAHALGKYEIALDSPEVLDLYGQESNMHGTNNNSGVGGVGDSENALENAKSAATDGTVDGCSSSGTPTTNEPTLREGWETRILHHHNKIIRAKNNANPTNAMGRVASASSTMGGMPIKSTASTTAPCAMPPPALISALRQIFGSTSSHNLPDLLDNNLSESSNIFDGDNTGKIAGNTLPSLLSTVLNHPIFALTSIPASLPVPTESTDSTPSLNNFRRTGSGGAHDKRKMLDEVEGEVDSVGEREARHSRDSSSVATSVGGGEKHDGSGGIENTDDTEEPPLLARPKEMCVPLAANLESILGNVCRDILHNSGTPNSRLHGLLIAALSVMTGCLFSQEELESMNFGGVPDGPDPGPTTTATTSRILDSSNTTDPFEHLLQVGALLATFPTSEEMTEFALDKQLLQYFVSASSLYEERIEIQKATLFQSQMPSPPSKDVPEAAQLLPLPNASSLQDDKSSDIVQEVMTSVNDVAGVDTTAINSAERGGDSESSGNEENSPNLDVVPASDDKELTDGWLTRHIDNFSAHSDDDDDDDDGSDANDSFDEVEDPNAGDESSESEHDDDTDSSHEESDGEEIEDDDEELDNEDQSENDNEDEELQRALTLSLVPAVGADSSDESHSDDGCSNHSEDSGGDADSNVSDAIIEAAAGCGDKNTMEVSACATVEPDLTTATLPPLLTPPALSALPSHYHSSQAHSDGPGEEDKLCSHPSSVFEPSALSSFGKLPASHVLVHLLLAILGMMQERYSLSDESDNNSIPSRLFSKRAAMDEKDTVKSAGSNAIGDTHSNSKFVPDSTTASFLIAFLHLSSHLRDLALARLNDCISSSEEEFAGVNFRDGGGIQIAHPSSLDRDEADDPLIEKDDPAGAEAAAISSAYADTVKVTSDSFDNKGLKRKAAAAVQIAGLRYETQKKLVKTWTNRVAFYSTCCILNLKCLRLFMGKTMEQGVASSSDKNLLGDHEKGVVERPNASALFPIPTKTRLSLVKALSSFFSSAASKSFQSLKLAMNNFYKHNDETMSLPDSLQDQLLVSALCNESLCLWGYALPLLYPDHLARVELLGNMLESFQSSTSASSTVDDSRYLITESNSGIKSCTWSDSEMQCWKLEILCKRLRVSDMLDCFVGAPIMDSIGIKNKFYQHQDESNPWPRKTVGRQNSLRSISLLSKTILERSQGDGNKKSDNLTKFYLALCQRATSFLILWNDLSISSIDTNDHDISGGESSINTGSVGGIGSSWVDRRSLQLEINPESFQFDSTKCADSISVTSSSSSSPPITANQRAAKVWGTVLSTTCFLPKSGVHRWAVKLDKCERGHVFVGVSTARTNLKTYVGGDSYGWGLIGTQALWHDRSKLRGDYGSTFRTGAVVVITLDTNVGTLSFGLWKEGSSASDAPHAPLSTQSLLGSPLRVPVQGQAGGGPYVEDWGIAFEGLPLDVKLYPAVGLYQRDDRVTLCTVSKSIASSVGNPTSLLSLPYGDLYFPASSNDEDQKYKSFVRSWNQALCSDGVAFATEILGRSIQHLSNCDALLLSEGDVLLTEILPCLASSICLIPSCIPTLSVQYATELLPFVTRCAKAIDKLVESKDCSIGIDVNGGEWAICSSSTSEGNSKEGSRSPDSYFVLIERNAMQTTATGYSFYQGKSLKNDFVVIGTSSGTRLHLVEDSCTSESHNIRGSIPHEQVPQISARATIIDARLNLDGTKFEGVRYRVENGSSELVTGFLQKQSSTKASRPFDFMKQMIRTECILSLAVGHLSLILCSQTSMSDVGNDVMIETANKSLEPLISTSFILSRGVSYCDGSSVRRAVHSIWDRCNSEDMYTHIREQWKYTICNDLLYPTDNLMDNAMKMEDAMAIIEQRGPTSWVERMGSLSRLCPDKYETAQKSIASAIFYHTYQLSNDSQSEIASQAIQHSLQILENGIRGALLRAGAGAGVRFKTICEDHCSLLVLIAKFLFEFSCVADFNQSMECIVDDIALISKSINTEKDLVYIKQKMSIITDQSIIQCVGLRSVHFLLQPEDELQGVSVHAAVEAALVSLPRLLCPPALVTSSDLKRNHGLSNHCTSRISGCSAIIQTHIHSSIRNIYGHVGLILAAAVHQVTKLPTLGLLACYFTDVHPKEHNDIILHVLPSLRVITDRCRGQVLSPDPNLLDIVFKQRNQRLLETSVSILLVACGQLSHGAANSSLVDVLSENLFHEITESIVLATEDASLISEREEKEVVRSDWITSHASLESKPATSQSAETAIQSSKSPEYLAERIIANMNGTMLSEAQSSAYLTQLLDILHVVINSQSFIEGIIKRSETLLSTIGFTATVRDEGGDSCSPILRLPLRFRRRLLRLLRPILAATDADSSIIRQLLFTAGAYVDVARGASTAEYSNDDLLVAWSTISLLRHLYTCSSSWRNAIHQQVAARGSNELSILHGTLTFLGGSPGSLYPGDFVVIDPKAASSSSTVGSTKTRHSTSQSGLHLNTSGSGSEEIAAGLCRVCSLSGVISSIDSHHGTCEVILLDQPRTISKPLIGGTITTRAIHVSATHISAANELPLLIDVTDFPAIDVFIQLSDTIKNVSSAFKSTSNVPDSDLKLDIDAYALLECSLGLRSTTVLISEPNLLQKCIGHESDGLRSLVAQALFIGSVQNKNVRSVSSLPSLEARAIHLLLMRLAVKSRARVLDHTGRSKLEALFEDNQSNDLEDKERHTSSLAEPTISDERERTFRSSISRDTSSNERREDETSGSSLDTEQNNEDNNNESSDDAAAAHLREAAIVQMAELGLPRQWAELALSRVGGTNIEAAVHFCLERGGDMERLLAENTQRRGASTLVSGRRRGFGASRMNSTNLIRQLVEMGFPHHWCVEALSATRNNVDEALTWILMNGDRLSLDDEAVDDGHGEETGDDDNESEEDEAEVEEDDGNHGDNENDEEENCMAETIKQTHASEPSWSELCPIRCVSGRPDINPLSLEVTGSPNGDLSSVGTKGVLLTTGKWYYEVEIKTVGCLYIGWADSSFTGHSLPDQGDCCGNGPHIWTFDGWRRYRWHANATDWGCKWNKGDIVGCLVDMDSMSVSFTLNGKGEEIGMGIAFSGEGFRPCSGVYAYVSLNRREQVRFILGGNGTEPFKYPPPDGYFGVGEAILEAVKERDALLAEEKVLDDSCNSTITDPSKAVIKKKYISDCSDGEHGHELFAWQHRYYGSDASVHLGASRPSIFGGSRINLKPSKNDGSTDNNNLTVADISSRLSKIFAAANKNATSKDDAKSLDSRISKLRDAYAKINDDIESDLKEVLIEICVLYSQKLVIHLLIASSNQFDLQVFLPTSMDTPWSELEVSRRLWQIIEKCTSLQTTGWVGEAGAMAVAAEALGLGISSGDHKTNSLPAGMCAVSASDDQLRLACGGVTQFLSAATSRAVSDDELISTAWTFAACAENAVGRGVGGALSFIRTSMQSAVTSSSSFRAIILAAVRRATRLLSAAESGTEDSISLEEESEDRKRSDSTDNTGHAPDARLVSFLTGLLVSVPVSSRLSGGDNETLRCELFEAWCIGLLSASSPWRMVSAFTAAGILSICPQALTYATSRTPTIARYFGGLESKVLRRSWAERAAVPVVSKYSQALIELLASVKGAVRVLRAPSLSISTDVDTSTPNPSTCTIDSSRKCNNWECSEGWVISNETWDIWTGTVELMDVDWKTPARSSAHTLMDSGEGPPMLRESCTVMRGVDWDYGNEDGKDIYEQDKLEKENRKLAAETEEKARRAEQERKNEIDPSDPASEDDPAESSDPHREAEDVKPEVELDQTDDKAKRKQKKSFSSKLPLGTVLSIEPWKGIPAMARRVRWHLTDKEGIYRYGGDGGRFDLQHAETNEKETRVKKKHPVPETHEQCASRCGFGARRMLSIILRLNKDSLSTDRTACDGILEWPDFGAGVRVECMFYSDGAISITEREVLYGSKDSGWEPRFGQPNFVSGQTMVISPTRNSKTCDDSLPAYDELLGSNSFLVKHLRNKEDGGGPIRVTSEMRVRRATQSAGDTKPPCPFSSSQLPPICFDPYFHASSLTLSKDMKSVTCTNSEGRGVAFGNVGFTKGVHYWEVKLEKAEIGSVYIGVAEKPSDLESQPKLNRWLGWGFVNFRATFASGAERVYGVHCHAGDTIGILLDCDAGRLNYFIDGVKYGEHILNDLGCAFENISPMGFDADGCGSGGAAQGAPSAVDIGRNGRYHANSVVQPKALWPVIGLRHPGDRVTISSKWLTSHGVDGAAVVKNMFAVDEVLCAYEVSNQSTLANPIPNHAMASFPPWFIEESFNEYNRWESGLWYRSSTRGSGPCKLSSYCLDVELDISPLSCAAACASIGLPIALLHGDRVNVKRSAGRILELQEEAVILGAYQGNLFYRIVSQKSEGGSLTEGGGRSWFWDESEAVEGGLELIGEGLGRSVSLPKLRRFIPRCGGLRVVYPKGAVVRFDLEISEGSSSIGTIASGTIIPPAHIIERRLNSCGVARYLIDYEPFGRGWISSRIRGGNEEQIVEILPVCADKEKESSCESEYITPEDSAREWFKNYTRELDSSSEVNVKHSFFESMKIRSVNEFGELLMSGVIGGMTELESDALIAFTYGRICDTLPYSSEGGCSFHNCALVLCAAQSCSPDQLGGTSTSLDTLVHEVANEALARVLNKLPSTKALMARISMLRALNKRARYALPWLPLRSAQEGSSILGGLGGFGSSLERAGRTWDTKSQSSWIQTPSISSRLRKCKTILFPSTSRYFLDSVMDATTSPTPLSHDEYELPREVRTVRVNRLKARRAMASNDISLKKKHSVFSQLQRDMNGWSGATLRRGFVAKGHGGQKRAFKVKLVGEGVNDYSGPYREVFTDSMQEITDIDSSGCSSLGVLQPSANNQTDVGDGRDLFIFALPPDHNSNSLNPVVNTADLLSCEEKELLNNFTSLTQKNDESYREIEEAVSYLGKLVGTACRHGIPVDLPLPLGVVWDRLTEDKYNAAAILKEIDILAFKTSEGDGHHTVSPTYDYILATQRRLLNAFTEGLSSVVPVEIFSMFTGAQLRDIICGNPEIDVELLRRVVEYEGYTENDTVITYFWEVLREMTTSERKLFLQFVWARNRLPLKASDFEAPFLIQKDTKDMNENGDFPLPSASTCFFSLTLPEYPTKEELKQKLLFAIENVTTMESDFVTNDAEISEGWRGL